MTFNVNRLKKEPLQALPNPNLDKIDLPFEELLKMYLVTFVGTFSGLAFS